MRDDVVPGAVLPDYELSDHGGKRRKLSELQGPDPMVLEPRLVVYKVYNGYWFFGRPTIEDLRQDLRAILRKCRPDWDITNSDLKAAWQHGDKKLFYPYDRAHEQPVTAVSLGFLNQRNESE